MNKDPTWKTRERKNLQQHKGRKRLLIIRKAVTQLLQESRLKRSLPLKKIKMFYSRKTYDKD